MWTIDYTSNDQDFRVSYDNEEIHTDSPALELFILKDINNPPTLYATPVGPAEVFDPRVAHLAYYLVANILVEKLGIKEWQTQGDYLWPIDPDHEPIGSRTVFSYVDYLKSERIHTITASNDCHNPAGSGGGQFCRGDESSVHVHNPDKTNPTGKGQQGTTLVKWGARNISKLEKELTEQGIDDMNPILGVINHVGTHTLVYRNPEGKILGAYTIDIDKKEGVRLLDFRVLGASQRQGVGTKLMQAAAKIAIDQTAYKTMLHVGSVGTAIPFYQKHGAEYQLVPGNGFDKYGIVDQKETKTLSEGKSATDKRTPDPYETDIPHDTFGNVLGYNHVGWKDFADLETNKPIMTPKERPPYRPITNEKGELLPWVQAQTKRRDASDYGRYIWTNDQPTIQSQWTRPEHSLYETIPVDPTLSIQHNNYVEYLRQRTIREVEDE